MRVSKWLISLLAVLSVVFFFACSDDGKDGGKENVLNVKGGELGKDPDAKGAIDTLPNKSVTGLKLDEFIYELGQALGIYLTYGSEKDTRADLPDEYGKETYKGKSSYKEYGEFSGRVEVSSDYDESYTWNINTETETENYSSSYKFFDYSNSGNLFLGGALGIVETENYKNDTSFTTTKYNGTIEFAGVFKGKIVFKNVVLSQKYKYHTHDEDGNCVGEDELIQYEITSGSFYVESYNDKVNLPDWLLERLYPNSYDSRDYGNDKITISMPSVPGAPNGKLTDRGGVAVNANNITDFFRLFISDYNNDDGNSPNIRGVNENGNYEALIHGKESGYSKVKGDYKYQRNNSGSYSSTAGTAEYFDYSNDGLLYLGGGVGGANYGFWKYTNDTDNETNETKMNGKISFTGDFKGTLDFQNFYYKYEYKYSSGSSTSKYTHISGKVMIGTLDVTDEFFRYVVKGESIGGGGSHTHNWVWDIEEPTCYYVGYEYEYCTICYEIGDYYIIPKLTGSQCDGGGVIDQALVGTWKMGSYSYEEYFVFNSDGKGGIYYYEYNSYGDVVYSDTSTFSWATEDYIVYLDYEYNYGGYDAWYYYDVSSNLLILDDYREYNKYTGSLPMYSNSSSDAKLRSSRAVSSDKLPKIKLKNKK